MTWVAGDGEHLRAALGYARRGIPVLPLHHPVVRSPHAPAGRALVGCSCDDPACRSIGKHPLTHHGVEDATTNPDRLRWWWRRFPDANVGLATGALFDVLDVDGPHGGDAPRGFLVAHVRDRQGPLVRTGGDGWHFYLAPSRLRGPHPRGLARVSWRGRGSYVVAPPSRHASGAVYAWVRGLDATLPEAPSCLRERLRPPPAHGRRTGPGRPQDVQALLERWLYEVARARDGHRSLALYQAGLRLYSLVAGGVLDREHVEAGLLAAARVSRLLLEEPFQTRRTLALAEEVGLACPAGVPTHAGRLE